MGDGPAASETVDASGDRALAFLALARWPNAVISAAAVLLGAWFASGRIAGAVWPVAAAGALLTAFANADNDVCDAELDRVAHPDRPIPRGEVSVRDARRFAWAAAGAGTLAAARSSIVLGLVSASVVANMAMYNRGGSRSPWLKNGIVAGLASLPFFYGGWVAGRPEIGVRLALVAMPLHFAREVAKDIDDAAADAATRRTLPVVAGARVAALVIVASLVLFGVGALLLARERAWLLAPAALLAARGAVTSWRGERGAPTLFKAAMLAGMAGAVTLRAV